MLNAAQRQRKLAAKVAKRKAVVAQKRKAEAGQASLGGLVRLAAKGPIVHCLMPANLFGMGMGTIVVARRSPSGLLGCAYFLVDTYCLGVKDAFFLEMTEREFEQRQEMQAEVQDFVPVAPAKARKLIRDAMAYAEGLGLSASDDADLIEPIFGDVDANECTEEFTFGLNGKPVFVSGPNDTPAQARAITRALAERQAPG
jgi:hypothetical protein